MGYEAETEAKAVSPLQAFEDMDLSAYRCLMAEDNDLNAEIAADILAESRLQVDRARDGAEAVDMLLHAPQGYYDIILMDIQMPRMNGYDATRAIRSDSRADCRTIPIVAMTANAFAEDVQAARAAGMDEHIAKPLDLKALARVMSRYLLRQG